MRSREEIEEELQTKNIIVELLLDIRDLLVGEKAPEAPGKVCERCKVPMKVVRETPLSWTYQCTKCENTQFIHKERK